MVLPGGFLVFLTWAVVLAVLIVLGSPFVLPSRGHLTWRHVAAAGWWGVLLVLILGVSVAFFAPLASRTTVIAVTGALTLAVVVAVPRVRRCHFRSGTLTWSTWLWLAGIVLAIGYLAVAVLGPVTHYDAGLYQWAAGRYAADYPVIPGLANLYAPLGYGGGQPVFQGLLTATPWGVNGMRLVNGTFLALLALETTSRIVSRPRRAGTSVAVAGTVIAFAPMLWMTDFWVASPTPDVPVLVLGVVLATYWTDYVTAGGRSLRASREVLPVLILVAGMLVAVRPTMVPLVALTFMFAALVTVRRRGSWMTYSFLAAIAGVALLGVLLAARDRMLSGWLQFPLSVIGFDVPWRAPDPTGLREATLGFARNPGDWQAAISGWGWIGPWLGRLPDLWDPWLFLGVTLAGAGLLLAAKSRGRPVRARALAVTAAPFLLASCAWFVWSPPAFRFGWAPLFGLASIVAGWGIWRARWTSLAVALAGLGLAGLTLTSVAVRFDGDFLTDSATWLGIEYRYTPLPTPRVGNVPAESGLMLLRPIDSDQCWGVYPLCTPQPDPALRTQNGSISSGFVP